MRRTKIKDLLKTKPEGQDIFVQGWVRSRRDSKEVSFVILNDGSIISTIQLVLGADYRDGFENEDAFKHILQQINTGACIGVRGKISRLGRERSDNGDHSEGDRYLWCLR